MHRAYGFAMPNLPTPTPFNRRLMKRVKELLDGLEGLIAVTPHYPEGTLLYFETLNQAKVARNKVEAAGPNPCGRHIMLCEISDDMKSVNVIGKAEEA